MAYVYSCVYYYRAKMLYKKYLFSLYLDMLGVQTMTLYTHATLLKVETVYDCLGSLLILIIACTSVLRLGGTLVELII